MQTQIVDTRKKKVVEEPVFENSMAQKYWMQLKALKQGAVQGVIDGKKDIKLYSSQANTWEPADKASSELDSQVSITFSEMQSKNLGLIERALRKFNQGTFGVCEDCNDPMLVKRLDAQPFAMRCLQCEGIHERAVADRKKRRN